MPQFLVHILASIHPTYRATTNPMKFVPESWRDYKSSLNSPGMSDSVIPDLGQPKGEVPDFEDLRNNNALEGRRKANAVFVVLGKS
jgi:alpha 1,2-mannosyltransferase